MSTLHVLSIDFDVFPQVSFRTMIQCYPDGLDLPTELSECIWSYHYATPQGRKLLEQIYIPSETIKQLLEYIKKNTASDIPCLIAQSHKSIYPWILKQYHHESVSIYHLDTHEDRENQNKTLDCGNWLSFLERTIRNVSVTWIANPVTKDYYNIPDTHPLPYTTDLRTLKDKPIDAIFLCRSDNWVPPHLDPIFDHLKTELSQQFPNTQIESCVNHPRTINRSIQNAFASLHALQEQTAV